MLQNFFSKIKSEVDAFIRSKSGRHAVLAYRAAVGEGLADVLTRREFAKVYRGVATESNFRTCMKEELAPAYCLELSGHRQHIRDIKRMAEEEKKAPI